MHHTTQAEGKDLRNIETDNARIKKPPNLSHISCPKPFSQPPHSCSARDGQQTRVRVSGKQTLVKGRREDMKLMEISTKGLERGISRGAAMRATRAGRQARSLGVPGRSLQAHMREGGCTFKEPSCVCATGLGSSTCRPRQHLAYMQAAGFLFELL